MQDFDKHNLGYHSGMTVDNKRYFREQYCTKTAWVAIGYSAFCHLSIFILVFVFYVVLRNDPSSAVMPFLVALMLLFITRQMRALENIVHFGCHGNFSCNKRTNDLATNLCAAWPLLQDVDEYRISHSKHHADFGGHADPCRARFEQIGQLQINLSSRWHLIAAVLRWMPGYVAAYYAEIGFRHVHVARFAAWHATILIGSSLLVSPGYAMLLATVWMFCMMVTLPVLRAIAEYSEHNYRSDGTVIDRTYNNLGLIDRLLIHPAGDAYHALHHLHPSVQFWRQGAAHHFLKDNDPEYRNSIERGRVLGPARKSGLG